MDYMYKIPVSKKVDVVIASAGGFPYDINLYQVERAVRYNSRILREGGTLILVAECKDGIGNYEMQKTLCKGIDVRKLEEELRKEYSVGKWVAWDLLVNLKKFDILIFSNSLKLNSKIEGLHVIRKWEKVKEFLLKKHGKEFDYVVNPFSTITLPVL